MNPVNGLEPRDQVYRFSPPPLPKIMTKIISLKSVSALLPSKKKPLTMYSVSYFCTKMHHFKATFSPSPLVATRLSAPYWTPSTPLPKWNSWLPSRYGPEHSTLKMHQSYTKFWLGICLDFTSLRTLPKHHSQLRVRYLNATHQY